MSISHPPLAPTIHAIFEHVTGTWEYVISDPTTLHTVIIDPVLDFSPDQLLISTTSVDRLLSLVTTNKLIVTHILETHAHADHLTASRYLQHKLSLNNPGNLTPKICIGKRIKVVQATFAAKYSIPPAELQDAFDILWDDDQIFALGSLQCKVLHLPGHTPDHVGYMIEGNVFTGDSIFNPDVGSARADFPGGSVTDLYASMQALLSLPEEYRLFVGHDYPPPDREVREGDYGKGKEKAWTTVGEQRESNKHVKKGTKEEEFVKWRAERDAQLTQPKLLHWALQVNVRGGRMPRMNGRGDVFFMIPVGGEENVLELLE